MDFSFCLGLRVIREVKIKVCFFFRKTEKSDRQGQTQGVKEILDKGRQRDFVECIIMKFLVN